MSYGRYEDNQVRLLFSRTQPNTMVRFRYYRLDAGSSYLNMASGRGSRIRTYDPLLPKQMRYQAAPYPETSLVEPRNDSGYLSNGQQVRWIEFIFITLPSRRLSEIRDLGEDVRF